MKNLSIIALALSLLLPMQSQAQSKEKLKGSKVIISKTIELNLEGVTAIETSRSVSVEIVDSDIQGIEISANDNLMDFVDLRVDRGTLIASLVDGLGTVRKPKITIKVPYNGSFSSYSAASGSEIVSAQYTRAQNLELKATSAGKIKIDATVDKNCHIEASASGKVELSAKIVGNCYVAAQSSASVRVGIYANELYVDAAGSSKVEADGNVEQLIVRTSASASFNGEFLKAQNGDLNATSSSSIVYFGVNNFVTNTASSGTVTNTKFLNEN